MEHKLKIGKLESKSLIFAVLNNLPPLETIGKVWKLNRTARQVLLDTFIKPWYKYLIKHPIVKEWSFKTESELIFFLKVLADD